MRATPMSVEAALDRSDYPFAEAILKPAHGALITSATLRDAGNHATTEGDWRAAEVRVGAITCPNLHNGLSSALRSTGQTKRASSWCAIIDRRDYDQLAAAYRELAACGRRRRTWSVHAVKTLKEPRMRGSHCLWPPPVSTLYAPARGCARQTGTLVDLFRAEEMPACWERMPYATGSTFPDARSGFAFSTKCLGPNQHPT